MSVQSAGNQFTIFLAGDSTCENVPANWFPRKGWGMEFGKYFMPNVQIDNCAIGGLSSRSFIELGFLQKLLEKSKPGDYLFIQFGHNDTNGEKRYTILDSDQKSDKSYQYNLNTYINSAKGHGIIPVLLTSIMRRNFSDGILQPDDIMPYREAMIQFGKENDVISLDVGSEHKELLQQLGPEKTKQLFLYINREDYPDYPHEAPLPDDTHISYIGADEIAKIVVHCIKKHKSLSEIAQWIDISKDINPIK